MGFADADAFAAVLLPHLTAVAAVFSGLLAVDETPPDSIADQPLEKIGRAHTGGRSRLGRLAGRPS